MPTDATAKSTSIFTPTLKLRSSRTCPGEEGTGLNAGSELLSEGGEEENS